MLLLAIMGTDVVQLESRLVEEDLLLCNIKRGEKGRGKRGVQTLQWELQGVFGIICASNSLGLEPAWKPAKGRPWFERAAAEPGLGGEWAMSDMRLSSKLLLHLSGAPSLNITVCHGTALLEKRLTTPPVSAGNLCRAMDMPALEEQGMKLYHVHSHVFPGKYFSWFSAS